MRTFKLFQWVLYSLLCVTLFACGGGDETNLSWVKQAGTNGGDTVAKGIGVDGAGNSYVAGYTNKSLLGQNQTGYKDYFVAKYDPTGALAWSRQAGTTDYVTKANGIAVDSAGNSYITGEKSDPRISASKYFIAKYDLAGKLIWTTLGAASGGQTIVTGIDIDSVGNSYVTGYTGNPFFGNADYFIAKYDSAGDLVWSMEGGASAADKNAFGISVDSAGNSYVTGYTKAPLIGQKQIGVNDYFIVKYDSNGKVIWRTQGGVSGGKTRAFAIDVDSSGNSYVTGYTDTPLIGEEQTESQYYFIAKHDSADGKLIWTTQGGASGGYTTATGIGIDSAGNSYVTGHTDTALLGQSQTGLTDYFIAKHNNSTGALVWSSQAGASEGHTRAFGIAVNTAGNNYYVTGETTEALSGQTQTGITDYFIVKK
ncbi:MAG: hypothetical protein K0R08_2143 [Solimicrobium sp.]|jgi:hypothetical protein|nr:hypothetical protein [Solimicrobium sp.]